MDCGITAKHWKRRSKMKTAHKIRMNPTAEQVEYLKRACGTRRFIYNWGREQWEKQYQAYKREQETVPEAERTLKPPTALARKQAVPCHSGTAVPLDVRYHQVRGRRGLFRPGAGVCQLLCREEQLSDL